MLKISSYVFHFVKYWTLSTYIDLRQIVCNKNNVFKQINLWTTWKNYFDNISVTSFFFSYSEVIQRKQYSFSSTKSTVVWVLNNSVGSKFSRQVFKNFSPRFFFVFFI